MATRVLVLGAGFGGLEVAAGLSERHGGDVEVTVIDRADAFVFGFAKLDVMFGRRTAGEVSAPYARIDKPGVRLVRAEIQAIDPAARQVRTDAGDFDADVLVIALGADLDPAATPGLSEHGHDYYTTEGAFATREVLERFEGGRVVIGVAGPVFKCPPAPSETALLVHELLERRGLRSRSEITLTMPLPAPVPPVPDASAGLLAAFDERGIRFLSHRVITRVDADAVVFEDGEREPFDLFLAVPRHVAPRVVVAAGLAEPGGWIPVDARTFRTAHPGVYAIGDAAATGTPKAGVFAAGQGAIVAAEISAEVAGADAAPAYDGAGICYVEFGGPVAAKVDVAFAPGQQPRGSFETATVQIAGEKEAFRTSRLRRWFGASA